MKNILKLITFVALLALSSTAFAHDKHKTDKAAKTKSTAKRTEDKAAFKAQGDGVDTCPVTGEKIESKNIKGDFFGRTVYFCCEGCLTEAKKSPAAFVKPTHAAQVAALKNVPKTDAHAGHHAAPQDAQGETKFLGKGDGITTCPVTGEPVDKSAKGEVNGRTFYVCCAGCIDTIKKNPDLYLKKEEKKAEK